MNKESKKLAKDLYFLKPVLSFEEGCEYTGLSKSWMYKLTSTGKIPHYKPDGKRLYFKTEELENWMLRNKVLSEEEIRSKAAKHSLA
jgi:excisionase family DNA binding protein